MYRPTYPSSYWLNSNTTAILQGESFGIKYLMNIDTLLKEESKPN